MRIMKFLNQLIIAAIIFSGLIMLTSTSVSAAQTSTIRIRDDHGLLKSYTGTGLYNNGETASLSYKTQNGKQLKGWLEYSENTYSPLPVNFDFNHITVTKDRTFIPNAEFIITLDLNGGTGIDDTEITYDFTTETFTLPQPTYQNHEFLGWTGHNGTTPQTDVTIEQYTGGDRSYTANWKEEEQPVYHTVTFDTNREGIIPPPVLVKHGEKIENVDIEVGGYTVWGWYEEPEFINEYDFDKPVYNDFTLYAKKTPNTYTVIYNANVPQMPEGVTRELTGSTEKSVHTYDALKALTENGFSLENYAFSGWCVNADGAGNSYFNKEEIKNLTTVNGGTVTLYAQWRPKSYRIHYDPNLPEKGYDETYDEITGDAIYPKTDSVLQGAMADSLHYFDQKKALPGNNFSLEGYIFDGWYRINGDNTIAYEDMEEVINLTATANEVITLYAKWKPIVYTITYDTNLPDDPIGEFFGEPYDLTCTYDQPIEFMGGLENYAYTYTVNTKKDGSGETIFDEYEHYYVEKNFTNINNDVVTLYYIWEEDGPFTITFDANFAHEDFGLQNPEPQTVRYGEKASMPEIPEKEGYVFTGWCCLWDSTSTSKKYIRYYDESVSVYDNAYINSNGKRINNIDKISYNKDDDSYTYNGNEYDFDDEVYEDIALAARWVAKPITVHYDTCGRGETPPNYYYHKGYRFNTGNKYNNVPYVEDTNVPGYDFSGWYTDREYTKQFAYSSAAPFTLNEDTTVYAKWSGPINVNISKKCVFKDEENTYSEGPIGYSGTQTVKYGDIPEAFPVNTHQAFEFKGWYMDEDCTEEFDFDAPLTPDEKYRVHKHDWNANGKSSADYYSITVYAKYSPKVFNITYDYDGGTPGENNPGTFTYYNPPVISMPAKEGYFFKYWQTTANGITGKNTYMAETYYDCAYKAVWDTTPPKYKVIYVSGDDSYSSDVTVSNIANDAPYQLRKNTFTPNKDYLYFSGWEDYYGRKFADEEIVSNICYTPYNMMLDSISLYAQWNNAEYTVVYNSNKPDDSLTVNGEMEDSVFIVTNSFTFYNPETHGIDYKYHLSRNNYSINGYKFLYWYTKPQNDGTGKRYDNNQNITSNLSTVNGDVITLYAIWEKL